MIDDLKRGEIVLVNLDPARGSESKKTRPCLVVQNDTGNQFSPLTIIVIITSQKDIHKKYPTDVWVDEGEGGLDKPSIIQCDQIRTIDKNRIIKRFGLLDISRMMEVDQAIKISLDLI
ncbi:MAG: type II toxin-antitoxin system PemK/MazF family toxin [Candidatus Aminicenantes bacterium]|nr:type II toxin-antitoxin system PemK/MazF family toxin [Candidatus Aminicenantes bacterium]